MNNAPLHEPSLKTAVEIAVYSILGGVHTALPGTIESYDYATCTASVKPSVQRRYSDGTVVDLPIISQVPVVWPRSSAGSISFPLNRGDGVLLVFAEQSLDEWLSIGAGVAPDDDRRNHISDAVAIPGMVSSNVQTFIDNNNDFQIVFKGQSIFIRQADGSIELGAQNVQALLTEAYKSALEIYIGQIQTAINAIAAGSLPNPFTAPTNGLTDKVKAQ